MCRRRQSAYAPRFYWLAMAACFSPAKSTKPIQFITAAADPNHTMWCKDCRQDVPAQTLTEKPGLCCPRCGGVIGGDPPIAPDPAATYDSWEIDEQLRHIGRVLHNAKQNGQPPTTERHETTRFDLPHAGPTAWHMPATNPVSRRRPKSAARDPASQTLIWLALLLGTTSLACGGILLAWSMLAGRPESGRPACRSPSGGKSCC